MIRVPATGPDAAFIEAWRDWSEDKWQHLDGREHNLERMRECCTILGERHAQTQAGIALKLRLALWTTAEEPWLQALALGGNVPGLASKMALADLIEQTLWSAIESLEAIGGAA